MQRHLISAIFAIAAPAFFPVQSFAEPRPNVLFIAVDDLRPSIGCYGDPHAITPHMDRLATQAVQFNRAYCQVAVCNPSRASLMTGLRPDNLGVWTLPIHFRESMPDAVTLPQWFRKFGYTAVSHGKIYHNPTPDPQSWSEPIRDLPRLPAFYPEGTQARIQTAQEALPDRDWRKNNLRGPSTASPDLPDDQVLDGARTNLAIEDLRRLGKSDEPFFLAMGYIRPHLAWIAPKKYWDMHDPAKLPVLTDQELPKNSPAYAMHNNSELTHYVDLMQLPKPWDDRVVEPENARHLMHAYYACVSYIDAQIGRLLSTLEEEGLADNTIVVLWSDHGWKLGEHRGWGKMTNYEIDARVPLLIAGPGVECAGQQTNQLAELLDVFPTLCEMAGIEVPEFVDGSSLVPILKDVEATVHDGAVNQYYRRHEGKQYMGYSVRTRDYRLVEWRDFSTGEVTAQELYDHRTDDSETESIIDSADPALVDELTALLLETHPRKGLVMTPAIHAQWASDGSKGKLTFENATDTLVRVHPILPAGRRGKAKRIQPGGKITLNARIGSVYVLESHDGTIQKIQSLSKPTETVVIQRDAKQVGRNDRVEPCEPFGR
ncbi:Choline-sulfatase [Rhodopirellula islandica]|uniref:Choline-sulfatase n=1 Tax=Rhodopirellula islandica TaxID=595434 RepID=A0A0J1BGD9_RHOIS|nr:sulfatase [Rhodopirellula islandica]KLU05610.1 Choline-sulfatase [Rhodopirellula islandica]